MSNWSLVGILQHNMAWAVLNLLEVADLQLTLRRSSLVDQPAQVATSGLCRGSHNFIVLPCGSPKP